MPDCVGYITLPVYTLPERQFTGLRATMLEAGPHRVSTGGGLGSDDIWTELDTNGKIIYRRIHGRDVLAAVALLVNHPDHARLQTTTDYKPRDEPAQDDDKGMQTKGQWGR